MIKCFGRFNHPFIPLGVCEKCKVSVECYEETCYGNQENKNNGGK